MKENKTMRILSIAALFLLPTLAFAQPATMGDANTQALGQMVVEAAQREAALRAQLIALQAHVAASEAKPVTPAPASGTVDLTPKDVAPK